MTFTEILLFLEKGYAVRRREYANELIVFKQIPAHINDVSFVKSIPEKVKNLLLKYKVGIDYENQYIIYDFITGVATYICFDGEDLNANDWEIVDEEYNPYQLC